MQSSSHVQQSMRQNNKRTNEQTKQQTARVPCNLLKYNVQPISCTNKLKSTKKTNFTLSKKEKRKKKEEKAPTKKKQKQKKNKQKLCYY